MERYEPQLDKVKDPQWLEALKFSPYWLRNKFWECFDAGMIVFAGFLMASPILLVIGLMLIAIFVMV